MTAGRSSFVKKWKPRKRFGKRKRLFKKKFFLGKNKLSSFPASRITTMRFSQNYIMNGLPDPNGMDENFIRANGLYQPDVSDGTLRNALGYDQWGTFYEKYVVLSAKIRCQFVTTINNTVNGVFNPYMCGIQLTDSVAAIPNLSTLIENRACKVRMMQGQTNGNMVTLTSFYNAKRWHGVKDVQDCEELDADFIISQAEANNPDALFTPEDKTYFRVFYQAAEVGVDPGPIQVNCLVTYTVMCKDPRSLSQSTSITTTEAPP